MHLLRAGASSSDSSDSSDSSSSSSEDSTVRLRLVGGAASFFGISLNLSGYRMVGLRRGQEKRIRHQEKKEQRIPEAAQTKLLYQTERKIN